MAGEQARPVRTDWRDRRDRPLVVPGELFTLYQPVVGPEATLAWLNLAYALQEVGVIPDPVRELHVRQGLSRDAAARALARLEEAGLLDVAADGSFVLREPAPRGQAALPARPRRWDASLDDATREPEPPVPPPAAPSAPSPELSPADVPDGGRGPGAPVPAGAGSPIQEALQAVVEFYHRRIGLLGPVQYEKLRFWVEEKQVSPDVVAAAIEETAASAENPRIQYVEGILRNWYNDGVRTMQDLIERSQSSRVVAGAAAPGRGGRDGSTGGRRSRRNAGRDEGGAAAGASPEGAPNAAAYRPVGREEIRRWKALYPEEYDDR